MVKKLIISLASILLFSSIAYAEEIATQDVEVDMSGIALIVNKQPENTAIQQIVRVKRSGLIFIVNVNGKVELPEKENK